MSMTATRGGGLRTGGPSFVKPGTGGQRIRHVESGRETTISGEALRVALAQRKIRKPYLAGSPIMNGEEIVVDVSKLGNWLKRGAVLIGPAYEEVGKQAKAETFQREVGEPGTAQAGVHVGKPAGGNALPGFTDSDCPRFVSNK